ncbi:MAG: hypothetical protein AMXMBFR37_11280 [Steroidobacteraceae bacterium]
MLACLTLLPVAAPAGDWPDVESRIQFAWYTGDLRALRGTLSGLAAQPDTDALHDYYLGLGEYRVAQLTMERDDRDGARVAAEACVDHLARANDGQRDFADALALQARCLSLLAGLKPWKAPLIVPRIGTLASRAVMLAPRNPRVLLLDALTDKDQVRALATLRRAIDAFEAERQRVAPTPSWGAPEAWLQLARAELGGGDAAGARSALERALLLAPDFAAAKRLLATITAG